MTPKKRVVQVRNKPLTGIDVIPFLGGLGWAIKIKGRVVSRFSRQAEAEEMAVFLGNLIEATVRFHKRNGVFKEERTFPGSRDPRRSKG